MLGGLITIVGGILRSIFGKVLGSTVGAGIVGAGAWLVLGSLAVAGIAAVVAFFVMIFAGAGVHVQSRAISAYRLDCGAGGRDRRILGEGGRDSKDERRGKANSKRRHRKSPKET